MRKHYSQLEEKWPLMRTPLGTRPGTTYLHSITTDTDPNFHSLYTGSDPYLFAYEPMTTVS